MTTQPNTRPAADHTAPGHRPPIDAAKVEQLAVDALLRGDPVAVHLFQWGHRAGTQSAVDRYADHAERTAQEFLDYLAEDPESTPVPIPPLDHDRRTTE